jgi:ABC-type transporter Mla subunit MlaD
MAHDGNTRREATQRLSDSGGARAPEPGAGRGSKPAPGGGGLSKLELGQAKPVNPAPVVDNPPRKFIPPEGVTKKIGSGSAPPDIPLPHSNAEWGAPARSGRAAAKVGSSGPSLDIPLPQANADRGAPARADKTTGKPGASGLDQDLPLPQSGSDRGVRSAQPGKPAVSEARPDAYGADGSPPPRARRRAAAPPRSRIAANDDAPSIGGLIFALQQKPSNEPFKLAAVASGIWFAVGLLLAWAWLSPEIARSGFFSALASPTMAAVVATVVLPIALFWVIALLAWRAQELRLMSAAMTEVAVRLAEPDRAAEQSAASLGQAVRRQVSFMNEAISRALGRAGELEGLVHNEVSSLEKAYTENENKIRGLIQELAGERHALVSTTDKVSETLKAMGSDVPNLIDKLSQQQIKLAKIIEGAGQNLIALESQIATASGGLETTLANRTQQLQAVLDDYTVALDATLASRAEALDIQLLERTRALDAAFAERLSSFDDGMSRAAVAIDSAVTEKARLLTHAMETHVRSLADTLGQHASQLDESMMHGIDAVRRTSDNVTRQSLTAIEGLSGQADLLKRVSENLVTQMSGVASQGQTIAQAASALESANLRIDSTLQRRQGELNDTLQRLSGKADQLDQVMRGYSQKVEGAISESEERARTATQQLAQDTVAHSRAAAAELERLRAQTDGQAARALDEMRARVSGVSQEVSQHLGAMASRFTETSEDLKSRAVRAAAELQLEQERIRVEAERLPAAARESAESMRSALSDQLRALEQLTNLSARERRDVTPPGPLAPGAPLPLTAALHEPKRNEPTLPVALAPDNGADRWSLGDLLSRASREDNAFNIANIARALDATTASAIWSRFRAGQRGIMVRSIYTNEGRALFDETSARYRQDMDFRRTVDRFLVDFEWMVRDLEQKDPSGRTVHNHLISDSGRVYLFLAHAGNRLR